MVVVEGPDPNGVLLFSRVLLVVETVVVAARVVFCEDIFSVGVALSAVVLACFVSFVFFSFFHFACGCWRRFLGGLLLLHVFGKICCARVCCFCAGVCVGRLKLHLLASDFGA